MISTILVITAVCVGVGMRVLWANPRRFANQVFAGASLFAGAWMGCVVGAIAYSSRYDANGVSMVLPWLRINGLVTGFFPWLTFLLCEAVTDQPRRKAFRRSLPLAIGAVVFSIVSWSEGFLPSSSTPQHPARGVLYGVACGAGLLLFTWLFVRTLRLLRVQTGVRRVEMVFLCLNLAIAFPLVLIVTSTGHALDLPWMRRLSFFILLASFALSGWALTFHRMYDARQIIVSLVQRLVVLSLLVGGTMGGSYLLDGFVREPVEIWVALAATGAVALWLDTASRRWLDLNGERRLAAVRAAVVATARIEPNNDQLIGQIERLIRNDGGASYAYLLIDRGNAYTRGHMEISKQSPALACLVEHGWATPESLDRRRTSAAATELHSIMAARSIGLIIPVPRGAPEPSLLVVLGTKQSRWPFTYPEVLRIQEVATLVDNILVRTRLVAEQGLKTKVDHLAMMSRALAHDLKNLMTPISSFLVHTTGRYPAGSAEEEVHSAARRSVATIGDYISEALFFSKRLTPNLQRADVRDLFATVLDITTARASKRGVVVTSCVQTNDTFMADVVLIQRLLTNVVNNAIDASSPGSNIVLGASNPSTSIIRFEVRDEGSGIPPEHAPRIFEPYFTTKQFGDDTRGFGLGLTICEKIVALHRGNITVRSDVGVGTTVTVDLPVGHRVSGPTVALPSSANA